MSDPPHDEPAAEPAPRQYLGPVHLLYAIGLLFWSVATFGPGGMCPAVVIVGAWTFVFMSRSRPRALAIACAPSVLLICIACVIGLLLPASSSGPREPARRVQCRNNLKMIGIALCKYHDAYGSLPPAYNADAAGKPKHSWRVLILPFAAKHGLRHWYNFNEPWDGPSNRQLALLLPDSYECPSRQRLIQRLDDQTNYLAVIGPRTAWPGATPRRFGEFADGLANTVLVIEADLLGIPWMEPRDLKYDDAIRLLAPGNQNGKCHQYGDFFYKWRSGRHVLFADGHVTFFRNGLSADAWRALLTVDDGKPLQDLDALDEAEKRLNLFNCMLLAILLLLVLLPLPWVWKPGKIR